MKKQSNTDPNFSPRKTKILGIKTVPADEFFISPIPQNLASPTIETHNRVAITVEKQIGLDDPIFQTYVIEESQAEEFIQNIENTNFDDKPQSYDLKEYDEAGHDLNLWFSARMSEFFPDCYDALYDAGVINRGYGLKAEILDGFPKEKIDWAKSKDAENWKIILETEYVLNNFPYYSLASYAVRIFYNHFIAYDDVSVAYLWREMQMVRSQEPLAIKYDEHIKKRKKGASKGARATSQKYKVLRNDCLLYVAQAYKEEGAAFLGAKLKTKAKTIRELAFRERPDDFINPQGRPLAFRWFLEVLEDFEAGGELGIAIEAAVKG